MKPLNPASGVPRYKHELRTWRDPPSRRASGWRVKLPSELCLFVGARYHDVAVMSIRPAEWRLGRIDPCLGDVGSLTPANGGTVVETSA